MTDPAVYVQTGDFLERTIPYEFLRHLLGRHVEVTIGKTHLMNWVQGVVEEENGIFYVRRQRPDGTPAAWLDPSHRRYQIKRKPLEGLPPLLGDGVWFEGKYLGQLV